jgi:hypothetical protein
MPRETADCGCNQSGARERTCLPCEIPGFCRNSYYRGKLLTERDFSDEQRLHNLALHGWGVLCGLVIKPHAHCPERRLVLTDGYAIDSAGREIRVLEHDEIVIWKPENEQSPGSAHTPLQQPAQEAQLPNEQERTLDAGHESGDDSDSDDGCNGNPRPKELYICIRYRECETELTPAPFDDCSCSTSSLKPNRVCESYKVEVSDHKPEGWDEATHEECEDDDCDRYYHEARWKCPKIHCYPCLPLAVVYNFVPGKAVTEHDIQNWKPHGPRRQLVSTATLDKVVRCVLDKLPTEELTRIEDTNWEHGRRIMCHEFMREFVNERGFRIEFSHNVHSAEIDPRSFQALVVFRSENMTDPKHVQVAPAHVHKDEGETKWCSLRIDTSYARKHLDGKNFDLFLTLKCDVITDMHGHAVDGNFIGHHLPTGDHIQGGTFESWIRIRHRR